MMTTWTARNQAAHEEWEGQYAPQLPVITAIEAISFLVELFDIDRWFDGGG